MDLIIDVEAYNIEELVDLEQLIESTLPMSYFDIRKDKMRSRITQATIVAGFVVVVLCMMLGAALVYCDKFC